VHLTKLLQRLQWSSFARAHVVEFIYRILQLGLYAGSVYDPDLRVQLAGTQSRAHLRHITLKSAQCRYRREQVRASKAD